MAHEKLYGHEIFKMLRPDQMKTISEVSEQVVFDAGERVFRKGMPATSLFIVLEGQVAIRSPTEDGMSLLIDEARKGDVIGSCICLQLDTYSLDAQCTHQSRLLKIEAAALGQLLQEDNVMGYAIQQLISRVYFKRYLETAHKLQAVVQAMPLELT